MPTMPGFHSSSMFGHGGIYVAHASHVGTQERCEGTEMVNVKVGNQPRPPSVRDAQKTHSLGIAYLPSQVSGGGRNTARRQSTGSSCG
jgi:hypothetical protein